MSKLETPMIMEYWDEVGGRLGGVLRDPSC
jgi:hypothetical protein